MCGYTIKDEAVKTSLECSWIITDFVYIKFYYGNIKLQCFCFIKLKDVVRIGHLFN